jgi:tetratricopeptide (TPR) repeat protein
MSKPEKIIEEAKRLEKSKSIFEYFMKDITYNRYEQISELYEKAGYMYKIEDKSKALECFILSYENLSLYPNIYDTGNYKIKKLLTEIAELYSKIDYLQSIEYYEKIIVILMEIGDIANIAKIYEIIGNTYFDNSEYEKAYAIYLKIIDLLNFNDKHIEIKRNVVEKICEIYCEKESIVDIFKLLKLNFDVGEEYLKKKLGYISARSFIFNGLLMNFATEDFVETNNNLRKYSYMDHTFTTTREHEFVSKLIYMQETNNYEEFAFLCDGYDKIKSLSKIQLKILLKIKNNTPYTDDYMENKNESENDLC